MLLQGLRSMEVLALSRDDVLLPEGQIRVRGKGGKIRFLPLAPEAIQLLDHYLRVERPPNSTAALFVSLKGRARGVRMTAAGLRSLFRYHRQTTGVPPLREEHDPALLGFCRDLAPSYGKGKEAALISTAVHVSASGSFRARKILRSAS